MQRALSASELIAPPMKPHNEANKMDTPVAHTLQKKDISTPASPQKTLTTAATVATKTAKGPQSDTQASPTPGQKTPLDKTGAPASQKSAVEASQPGPKIKPDASKTTESVTGKMFGFGSSMFSSASTLISSAVQEESRTTPPGSRKMSAPAQVSPKMSAVPKISPKSTPTVSPKMSPAREPKTLSQKPQQEKKPEESHKNKDEKAPSQAPKEATVSNDAGKANCPLCKVELNIGSKDPPNYNACTECKTTVCNQCGFNSMPIGEVSEGIHAILL